jgi:hypothetical protein
MVFSSRVGTETIRRPSTACPQLPRYLCDVEDQATKHVYPKSEEFRQSCVREDWKVVGHRDRFYEHRSGAMELCIGPLLPLWAQ